jgi:hypothetical protein
MVVNEVEHQATSATHNSRNRHYVRRDDPPPAIIGNSGRKLNTETPLETMPH